MLRLILAISFLLGVASQAQAQTRSYTHALQCAEHSRAIGLSPVNAAILCRGAFSNTVTAALTCYRDFGEGVESQALATACQGVAQNRVTAVWMCLDDATELMGDQSAGLLCNGASQQTYTARFNCYKWAITEMSESASALVCGGI
jgi:hypothetical protein